MRVIQQLPKAQLESLHFLSWEKCVGVRERGIREAEHHPNP